MGRPSRIKIVRLAATWIFFEWVTKNHKKLRFLLKSLLLDINKRGTFFRERTMWKLTRVALSVVPRYRRYEPSKGLVSQSLSWKLTCEREMAHKALAHSSECVREGEIWAHKALGLLLTAHLGEFSRHFMWLQKKGWMAPDLNQTGLTTVLACFNSVKHCFSML